MKDASAHFPVVDVLAVGATSTPPDALGSPDPSDELASPQLADSDDGESAVPLRLIDARAGAGRRLDQFLAANLDGVSRTRIQRWIALGAVQVDGQLRLPSYRLTGFEQILVEAQPHDSEHAFEPDPVPLVIVYRDADVQVIDKQPGLVTHPAPGNWRGTLMNGLLHADPGSARLPRAGIVHRLDRDTSGLLICARSERAFAALTAQLAQRTMGRRYLALVEGEVLRADHVEAPIGRDPRQRTRMAVVSAGQGKPARTDYWPLACQPATRSSALLLKLQSGRTHQIRVHMANRGFPLIGDSLYGGRPRAGFERQALHAWQLAFDHPADRRRMCIDAPVPADLRLLAEQLQLTLPPTAPAESVR